MATEVWSDLHQSLKTDATGKVRKVINVDAVKTSVDNILRTRYTERVMLPEFGCSLYDLLFSPMNEGLMNKIIADVQDSIQRWDDRIIVRSINVKQSPDLSQVDIDLYIAVRGYQEIFEMSMSF